MHRLGTGGGGPARDWQATRQAQRDKGRIPLSKVYPYRQFPIEVPSQIPLLPIQIPHCSKLGCGLRGCIRQAAPRYSSQLHHTCCH
jgi:hypothetical protein